jgi:hypothetical protein
MRFEVESWTNPQLHHVVDLLYLDGNSGCDCRDFLTRCEPNYKKNGGKIVEYGYPGHPDPERTRCRHCVIAIRYFTNHLLRRMAAEDKQPPQT